MHLMLIIDGVKSHIFHWKILWLELNLQPHIMCSIVTHWAQRNKWWKAVQSYFNHHFSCLHATHGLSVAWCHQICFSQLLHYCLTSTCSRYPDFFLFFQVFRAFRGFISQLYNASSVLVENVKPWGYGLFPCSMFYVSNQNRGGVFYPWLLTSGKPRYLST